MPKHVFRFARYDDLSAALALAFVFLPGVCKGSETGPVPITPVQACPNLELRAIQSYFADLPSVVIRRAGSADLLLGQGLAQVSPDCKHFLFASKDSISIFEVSSLGSTNGLNGKNAVWLPDSNSVVFSRGHHFELFLLSLPTGKATPFFKPTDATPCASFGDGYDWKPPTLQGPGVLKWTYAISDSRPKSHEQQLDDLNNGKPAKSVYIDIQSRKVTRTESTRLECDYYNVDNGKRARKDSR